jgi:methyl-accepting chemotaxis protein
LDRLTQEEAEMAAAQVLKATHAVDDAGRVRGVADIALSVDNKVAGVGDQVQGVGDQVQGVSDQVQGFGDQIQGVSDQLKGIDDVVAVVRDGAQYTFNQSSKKSFNP